jgi:hypothetical protein
MLQYSFVYKKIPSINKYNSYLGLNCVNIYWHILYTMIHIWNENNKFGNASGVNFCFFII